MTRVTLGSRWKGRWSPHWPATGASSSVVPGLADALWILSRTPRGGACCPWVRKVGGSSDSSLSRVQTKARGCRRPPCFGLLAEWLPHLTWVFMSLEGGLWACGSGRLSPLSTPLRVSWLWGLQ